MNIQKVEDQLVVVSRPQGVDVYDYDFELRFNCRHPHAFDDEVAVLRTGPLGDYEAEYAEKAGWGLRLVNSPAEHVRSSEIEGWQPLIADLTPRTRVYEQLPSADEISAEFDWPIFLKGSRQTAKHQAKLSIIQSPESYNEVAHLYRADPILHWQKPAIREFIQLEPIAGSEPGSIPASMEFRTFWWRGSEVGHGRYWHRAPLYKADDLKTGLSVAREAATRLAIPFVAIDIARTADGRWIVIECNDGQESGYAGVDPTTLWRNILAIETGQRR